ncbi:hypothetical protein OTU49_003836, partial [Cherax quadricarinatus]
MGCGLSKLSDEEDDGAPYGGSRRRRISASSQGEAGSQRTSRRGPAGGGTVPTSVAGRKKEVKHLKEETLTKTGSLDRAANRPARRSIIADTKDKMKKTMSLDRRSVAALNRTKPTGEEKVVSHTRDSIFAKARK